MMAFGQAQKDRLAYIELRISFVGEVRRADLMTRFGIETAAATRDLTLYRGLAPGNLVYNGSGKFYERGETFKQIFNFSSERVLTWLSQGFGDSEPSNSRGIIVCEIPSKFHQPDLDILSVISRAIYHKRVVVIDYQDATRGLTNREIIPFALADNGFSWHVRGFDRLDQEFKDFVLTRVISAGIIESDILDNETCENDIQWYRIVELELVPHPINVLHKDAIEAEYSLKDGVLKVRVRAALAGYSLRCWNVDCTEKASIKVQECHLWLRNRQALYGVENLTIAPGYEDKTSRR